MFRQVIIRLNTICITRKKEHIKRLFVLNCDLNITQPYVPCFKYGIKTTVEITVKNGSFEVLSTVVEMWTTQCV